MQAATTSSPLNGAAVTVLDGPDAGATATTNANGQYALAALKQAGFTLRATLGANYTATPKPVTLTSDQVIDFDLSKIRKADLISEGTISSTLVSPQM